MYSSRRVDKEKGHGELRGCCVQQSASVVCSSSRVCRIKNGHIASACVLFTALGGFKI